MIEGDCMISYLPLAHMYERLAQVRMRKLELSKVPLLDHVLLHLALLATEL